MTSHSIVSSSFSQHDRLLKLLSPGVSPSPYICPRLALLQIIPLPPPKPMRAHTSAPNGLGLRSHRKVATLTPPGFSRDHTYTTQHLGPLLAILKAHHKGAQGPKPALVSTSRLPQLAADRGFPAVSGYASWACSVSVPLPAWNPRTTPGLAGCGRGLHRISPPQA